MANPDLYIKADQVSDLAVDSWKKETSYISYVNTGRGPQLWFNISKYVEDFENDEVTYDVISEATAGSGVTIDGVLLKDNTVDVNGTADAIILDEDGDTTISSPTDDQIDFEIAGADDFTMTANTFTALSGSTIATNTIAETTAGSGVTADSVLLKDGGIVLGGLGRLTTSTEAAAAIDIDSTATRGEGVELRYNVSDYTNIPQTDFDSLGNAKIFTSAYLRSEAGVDGSDTGAVGAIAWGVANAVGAERIEGVRAWAYAKGDTTDSLDYAWGVRGEFSMDAGRANTLTLTEAAGVASRITSGKVDDYTKIHGFVGRFGDMDGGSRTYGAGLKLVDGPESGTSVLTNVIETDLVATNLIKVGASTQGGITVSADGMFADPETATEAGFITIDVGGTSYEIPFYASS